MMSKSEKITVVIIYYGKAKQLEENLKKWNTSDQLEIYLIDNLGDLRNRYNKLPDTITIIAPPYNLGFAGSINLVTSIAKNNNILVANSDVYPLDRTTITYLSKAFKIYPDADIVVPKLLFPSLKEQTGWQIKKGLNFLHLLSFLFFFDTRKSTYPLAGKIYSQPAGAALLFKRSALEKLGGLDATFYPAWFEDVDLYIRSCKKQINIVYYPYSIFIHKLGESIDTIGFKTFTYTFMINFFRLIKKFYPKYSLLLAILLPIAMLIRAAIALIYLPKKAKNVKEAVTTFLKVPIKVWKEIILS